MKLISLIATLLFVTGCSANTTAEKFASSNKHNSILAKKQWAHGSANCELNKNSANDVYQHNEHTFIIRQNKCLTFEAPFMYVLVGEHTILVLDTGALSVETGYSLYDEISTLLGHQQLQDKRLLVVHSHGHGDHLAGDDAFIDKPNAQVIGASAADINRSFSFNDWPNGQQTIDLGNREIVVIPTPGHQEEAITIYDRQTKWLLTGDTLYPGYIYVKNWQAYRSSIAKLANFAKANDVSAVLGAHIEMKSQPGMYYPIGTTYQPNEAPLDLATSRLTQLNDQLTKSKEPREMIFDDFIIKPMNGFQKTLSNVARWFTQ